MLDLFCGRFGWSRAFAKRGWLCTGIDLVRPPEIPENCDWLSLDVLTMTVAHVRMFDFACASSPCEEFSVHGMKHFHPNPKYPEMGIRLFNHTRSILEEAGIPYVMENVRSAQKFVGNAVHHCGPFYLWGTAVPPLIPKNIYKGIQLGGSVKGWQWKEMSAEQRRAKRKTDFMIQYQSGSKQRMECTANAATIPIELAGCIVDYAERICERGSTAAIYEAQK